MAMDAHEWKVLGFVMTPLLGLYAWFIRHISTGNRHPKTEDLVYNDVCTERGRANKETHKQLSKDIQSAIARSDEKHIELKADMKAGFSEIQTDVKAILEKI